MKGTRFGPVLRESFGNILREIKISFTPVPRPDKWLFVVGCYNSGTTLLAEMLSRHPNISGLPTEGHFITDQFTKDYEVGLPRMWAGREELFRLTENDHGPDPIRVKKEWGMRFDLSKPVLLEKSPPNTVRARWLNQHFSPAFFVAIVRNGYAVAEGISRKGNPMHLRDGWPIEQSALQWRRSVEVLEDDSAYLENFIWMKYEDFVHDPEAELQRITEFVGISKFDSFDIQSNFSIHERNESIKNMNDDSFNKLSKDQINKINEIASETLLRWDYNLLNC